jgi:hypothetical protein
MNRPPAVSALDMELDDILRELKEATTRGDSYRT